jgi:hypothetical protein
MNMIYNKPIVEKSLMEPSDSRAFSPISPRPLGPIITPEIINPIIAGILIFLRRMGDKRMINSNKENTKTGFFKGN